MAGSSDPLAGSQWHLSLIGDLETVWEEYSGQSVRVGVYDTGVDASHLDLDDNYNAALHVHDDAGNVLDGADTLSNGHGTAAAGLIGAEADNGIGGKGIAPSVSLTGVNVFDPAGFGYINGDVDDFTNLVRQATNFDIMSNSWGNTSAYSPSTSLFNESLGAQLENAYTFLTEYGRSGLGTNIIQAAGNGYSNANNSGFNATRFTTTVAATNIYGDTNASSNFGTSILVSAPAASVSTDITGSAGRSEGDYTTDFGGTSAATAVVAGVVALMLDANHLLGWRDVQTILAMSASLTGSDFGSDPLALEDGRWFSNGAQTWNGGGHAFHVNYGFGLVDAHAAVRLAETWTMVNGRSNTFANELHLGAASGQIDLATVNNGAVSDSILIADNLSIENISVTIDFDFSYYKYFYSPVTITLIAPDGTEFELVANDRGFDAREGLQWEYGITAGLGMESQGEWTLEIVDENGYGDIGSLHSWSIDFYGAQASNDDVFVFTDDFHDLAAQESGRKVVVDDNGGTDWLNLAAVTLDMKIDLANRTIGEISGSQWARLVGNFENVVSGDGDDRLFGNGGNNHLDGGRGNDLLMGYGGDDIIDGGQGIDQANGGAGNDLIYVDRLDELTFVAGGSGHDTLFLKDLFLPDNFDLAAAGFEEVVEYNMGRSTDFEHRVVKDPAVAHRDFVNAMMEMPEGNDHADGLIL